MKISYLITCSKETDTLLNLLGRVSHFITKENNDEIVVLSDDSVINDRRSELLGYTAGVIESQLGCDTLEHGRFKLYNHKLNNDYGEHKNFGIERCSGDFIFQLDGDELPSELTMGENLHAIINANPSIEAYAVPRINDFKGVTAQHAKQWGWNLSLSQSYQRPIVNFPDFQFRIFKKAYPRISFTRRLHEKIEGYSSFVCLPAEEEYSIYHDKTIETQVETNMRYNTLFSKKENQGHNVFDLKI
jgi:glycosyltransferase involved in cell wall biosynthesis